MEGWQDTEMISIQQYIYPWFGTESRSLVHAGRPIVGKWEKQNEILKNVL